MARNEKPEADTRTEQETGRSKKPLLILAGILSLCLMGATGWYLTQHRYSQDAKADKSKSKDEETAAPLQPKFAQLEQFTVNLRRENGDQLLQTTISFKYFDPALEEKIKANMPEIRNKVLLLLSAKHASELMTVEGKKQLADEIRKEANAVLGIHSLAPDSTTVVPAAATASGVASAVSAAPVEADNAHDSGEATEGIVEVLYSNFIIQ